MTDKKAVIRQEKKELPAPGQNISTTQAQRILEENGMTVSKEKAAAITDFLYKLSGLVVKG